MTGLDPTHRERTWEWVRRNRFGLFIHWGLYSLAARHEWVRARERMTGEQYRRYLERFEPDLYDPAEWAEAAREAGMSYAVLTSKHHEGFCLWPSAAGAYTVADTPHRTDIVGPFADAFRAAGLGVGLYYSLLDWEHPDFVVDDFHPQRADPNALAANAERDPERFRADLHAQIREILSDYGPLEIGFFDFSYPPGYPSADDGVIGTGKTRRDWGSEVIYDMARRLQPGMVLNDRLDYLGDFVTPEQYQPSRPMTVDGEPVPWIACQTINGSWGYDRDNSDAKSVNLLLRMLIDTVSKDGGFLINVGPDGRGRFDPQARAVLAGVGEWMTLHRRAIEGAGPSGFVAPADARYTRRGDRLYLHLFSWPFKHVHLAGLGGRIAYAQFLHDASELSWEVLDPDQKANILVPGGEAPGTVTLRLPERRPEVEIPVIEIFLAPDTAEGAPA